ncbi:MAG: hypothetical protein ACR2MU_01625 [Gaiellaceae bacterium]
MAQPWSRRWSSPRGSASGGSPSHVQLLEGATGEQLVRFAYSTGGTARRGPVTLRRRDLERLREALVERPALREALGLGD